MEENNLRPVVYLVQEAIRVNNSMNYSRVKVSMTNRFKVYMQKTGIFQKALIEKEKERISCEILTVDTNL